MDFKDIICNNKNSSRFLFSYSFTGPGIVIGSYSTVTY